jgi:hypothetical protein
VARTARTPLDEAVDELYGLPLDEFTAARNERAKGLRERGDTDAAKAVAKLGKPNTVAWLANQLVRRQRDEIDPLLELGASLRAATADLDAASLRQLSRQQHQVVYALVQQARTLAAEAGSPVSDTTARGLEDTLHAALADEAAAEELLAGRLTSGLTSSGFPGLSPAGSRSDGARPGADGGRPAPAKKAAAKPKTEQARRRAEVAEAREDERAAKAAVREAERAAKQARNRADAADSALTDVTERIAALKAELDEANSARAEAERAQRSAAREADRAEQALARAERRHEEAARRRDELGKP